MAEGIILPDDLTPEARAAIGGAGPVPPNMQQAAAAAEQREIVSAIDAVMGTSIAPYKDDAPICDAMTELQAVAQETDYNKVVQMPAWAHGRCIGDACARFKSVGGKPICGKALQDLAAATSLGVTIGGDVEREFARWAYPTTTEQPQA